MLVYIAEVAVLLFFLAGLVVAFRAILEIPGPNVLSQLAVAIILLVISLALGYAFDVWSVWEVWVSAWL